MLKEGSTGTGELSVEDVRRASGVDYLEIEPVNIVADGFAVGGDCAKQIQLHQSVGRCPVSRLDTGKSISSLGPLQ